MSATDPKFAELHSQLFDEGLEVRRAVLGREYVDNAVKNATPFTRPGQELITEWAWGTIWKRPGLDRKQRSLLSKCTTPLQSSPTSHRESSTCSPTLSLLHYLSPSLSYRSERRFRSGLVADRQHHDFFSCLYDHAAKWAKPANQFCVSYVVQIWG